MSHPLRPLHRLISGRHTAVGSPGWLEKGSSASLLVRYVSQRIRSSLAPSIQTLLKPTVCLPLMRRCTSLIEVETSCFLFSSPCGAENYPSGSRLGEDDKTVIRGSESLNVFSLDSNHDGELQSIFCPPFRWRCLSGQNEFFSRARTFPSLVPQRA
jgi:hypothetical protein